jgi:hypothetical protein
MSCDAQFKVLFQWWPLLQAAKLTNGMHRRSNCDLIVSHLAMFREACASL